MSDFWLLLFAGACLSVYFAFRPRPKIYPGDYERRPAARRADMGAVNRQSPLTETPRGSAMKRAVGYCGNTNCEDYAKGVFLLNHGPNFACPRCKAPGFVESERGATHHLNRNLYKEVRVEYNFDPTTKTYREVAVVRDEAIWGESNTYTLFSPLIKTEKRALKVAEVLLANLQRYAFQGEEDLNYAREVVLDFSNTREDFARKCDSLRVELERSSLNAGRS